MARPLLTIGIPSYSRARLLAEHLADIVGRLPDWVEILICDNCSDPPVELDADLLAAAQARGVRVRVHRQVTNLGAPANILRLFEQAEADWLLLTGDDDPVLPDVLEQLPALIERHPDAAIVKFSSPYGSYPREEVVRGLDGLMAHGGDFNQLLFMSTFMYRVDACRGDLRFAYLMALSAASQLALLIMAAIAGRPVVLSPLTVTRARDAEPAWSPADTRLNFYALADLPLTPAQRATLRAKIYRSHNLFREMLDLASIAVVNRPEASYLYRKSRMTHWIHGRGVKRWAAQLLLPLSALAGPLALPLLRRLYARSKGRTYQHLFVDRHDRL